MPPLLYLVLSNAVIASLLALVAAVVTYFVRRPALAHGLWLLVLLKLVTPPIIPLQVSWPSPENSAESVDSQGSLEAEHPSASEVANDPSSKVMDGPATTILIYPTEGASQSQEDPSATEGKTLLPTNLWKNLSERSAALWFNYLAPLWLTGSLLWLGWTLLQVYRFQRVLRHAQAAPEHLQDEVRQWADQLGLRKCPTLWLVPGCISPMLWTVGTAPRLLFPAKLLERLNDEQRSALLVHELAHLRRRDHWVRWVEMAVIAVYWWHPVVWWARRELHEAEEQCCDAWVVWALASRGEPGCVSARRAYALALLSTVDFFSHARPTLPAAASGVGQVPHLRRRLTMIMNGNTPKSLSSVGRLAVLGLGLMLPLVPVQAQSAPQDPKDDRDRQIETLKKVIESLEQQKHAERTEQMAKDKEFYIKKATELGTLHLLHAQEAAAQQQAQAEAQKLRAVTLLKEAQLAQNQDPERRIEIRRLEVDDKAGPEVQKAMRAIEELTRAIEGKRQELRGLEEKLQHVRADLERTRADGARRETQRRIEVRPAEGERERARNERRERIELKVPNLPEGVREPIILRIDPNASAEHVKKQVEEIQARIKQPIRVEIVTPDETAKRRAVVEPPREPGARPSPEPRPRERRDTRGDDLEQKLEKIMKEVDELRKELRNSRK
jgi:beta-lactamase regulating signal transducer with metallopeptidase domain